MQAFLKTIATWQPLRMLLLPHDDAKTSESWSANKSMPRVRTVNATTKVFNYILSAVFLVFTLMQFNDPDPLRWSLIYGLVAVVSLMAAHGRSCRRDVLVGGFVAALVWMVILLPEFVNWIQMGTPTIAGSMKAEEPHIEYTREFLGLSLCAMVLGTHLALEVSSEGAKESNSNQKDSSETCPDNESGMSA